MSGPARCQKTGKVIHPSKTAALITRRRVKNSLLNAYRCSACKGWHLGKSRSPIRLANRIDEILKRHEEELRKRLEARKVR